MATGTLVTPSTFEMKRRPSLGTNLSSGHSVEQAFLASLVTSVRVLHEKFKISRKLRRAQFHECHLGFTVVGAPLYNFSIPSQLKAWIDRVAQVGRTFKYTETHAQWASEFATRHVGFLVAGGSVGTTEAPVMLATLVVIIATVAQVLWLKLTRRKVDLMLWVSLALVVVLGGLTIWFKSETFIKWKPTGLHWAMATALWASQAFFGRNLLKLMMGEQLELPDPVWRRLNTAWVLFFVSLGILNLWVAYHFSTDTWVNFKLFGTMGLMLLFVLAQGSYISRHLPPEPAAGDGGTAPKA